MNYYQLLGASPDSSDKDIKIAYRAKALELSLDRQPDSGVDLREVFSLDEIQNYQGSRDAYIILVEPQTKVCKCCYFMKASIKPHQIDLLDVSLRNLGGLYEILPTKTRLVPLSGIMLNTVRNITAHQEETIAEKELKELNNVYEILLDPVKKSEYDLTLSNQSISPLSPIVPTSQPSSTFNMRQWITQFDHHLNSIHSFEQCAALDLIIDKNDDISETIYKNHVLFAQYDNSRPFLDMDRSDRYKLNEKILHCYIDLIESNLREILHEIPHMTIEDIEKKKQDILNEPYSKCYNAGSSLAYSYQRAGSLMLEKALLLRYISAHSQRANIENNFDESEITNICLLFIEMNKNLYIAHIKSRQFMRGDQYSAGWKKCFRELGSTPIDIEQNQAISQALSKLSRSNREKLIGAIKTVVLSQTSNPTATYFILETWLDTHPQWQRFLNESLLELYNRDCERIWFKFKSQTTTKKKPLDFTLFSPEQITMLFKNHGDECLECYRRWVNDDFSNKLWMQGLGDIIIKEIFQLLSKKIPETLSQHYQSLANGHELSASQDVINFIKHVLVDYIPTNFLSQLCYRQRDLKSIRMAKNILDNIESGINIYYDSILYSKMRFLKVELISQLLTIYKEKNSAIGANQMPGSFGPLYPRLLFAMQVIDGFEKKTSFQVQHSIM